MKDLKGSLGAKIAAQILLFLMIVLFIGSVIATNILIDSKAYSGGTPSLQNMSFYDYIYDDALAATRYYEQVRAGFGGENPFDPKTSNFSFVILDTERWEHNSEFYPIYRSAQVLGSLRYDICWVNGYYVVCLLNPDLSAPDKYQQAAGLFMVAFEYKWLVAALIPISFVLAILLFCYLMASAGYRKDGTLGYGFGDRISVDLLLLLVALPIIFLLYGAFTVNIFYDVPVLSHVMSVFMLAVVYVLVMWFLTSFARRVKHKGWWRNSILYHLCVLIKKYWKRIILALKRALGWIGETLRFLFSHLPLIWKVALAAVGILFVMALIWFFTGNWSLSPTIALILTALITLGTLLILALICSELRLLQMAGQDLAAGREMKLSENKLHGVFREHAENLGKVREGMALAMESHLRSERLKTELITNVSHDLKTPLTSIINYVDLLRREEVPEKQKEYVEILDKHSKRLKKLTEDLLEVSKVTTGNVSVDLELLDLRESMNQAIGEYSERLEDAGLKLVVHMPEKPVFARVDGRHMWRILDNLLSNACKYSMTGSRVYCSLYESERSAVIAIKNVSKEPLNIAPDELMERFVRGDEARSSEGSGLGLSIAQSLTEVQNGTFALSIDGDLFKTELRFVLVD